MLRNGFTLLEFLLSASLATILLTLGLPSLASLITSTEGNLYTRNLLDHLIFAQRQAIMHQQTLTACLAKPVNNATTESCVPANQAGARRMLVFIDTNQDRVLDISNGDRLLSATEDFSAKHTVTANRQFVRFKPDGTAIGTNMTVRFCIDQRSRIDIIISPSGRSRSEKKGLGCS
ncbi:GspH/FimT family pseudopilin [Aeromonas australiensis]|uniref:GspH/FimT family pseudopilin n=1 Tax=Aeromonas australiensis TaxID=1114880 RepID=UPI000589D742|nr:GspH/FimT family pseudopilin [Aeromonas australiensis]